MHLCRAASRKSRVDFVQKATGSCFVLIIPQGKRIQPPFNFISLVPRYVDRGEICVVFQTGLYLSSIDSVLTMIIFCVLLVFFSLKCSSTSGSDVECVYDGNMCNSDMRKCLTEGYWSECRFMSYPDYYATDASVEFWVEVWDLDRYPDNFTMTVARYQLGNPTVVENCCNLKVNESCILPGFIDSDYMLFAPTKARRPFCYRAISAFPAFHPKWCEENISLPCLDLEHGKVKVNELYEEISRFEVSRLRKEYCFFHAPEAYGRQGNFVLGGLAVDVEGIKVNGTAVSGENFETDCTRVELGGNFNLSHDLLYNNTKAGFAKCSFLRIKRYDKDWIPKPLCATVQNQENINGSYNWSTTIIAAVASVVFIVLVIISTMVCKRCVKAFCSVGEGIVTRALDDDNDYFMSSSSDKNETASELKLSKGKWRSKEEVVRYVSTCSNSPHKASKIKEDFHPIVPQIRYSRGEIAQVGAISQNAESSSDEKQRASEEADAEKAWSPHDNEINAVNGNAKHLEEDQHVAPHEQCSFDTLEGTLPSTDLNDNRMEISCDGTKKGIGTPKLGCSFDYIAKSNLILMSASQVQSNSSSNGNVSVSRETPI